MVLNQEIHPHKPQTTKNCLFCPAHHPNSCGSESTPYQLVKAKKIDLAHPTCMFPPVLSVSTDFLKLLSSLTPKVFVSSDSLKLLSSLTPQSFCLLTQYPLCLPDSLTLLSSLTPQSFCLLTQYPFCLPDSLTLLSSLTL